ncbi:MAG TPA: hypothetical protein V6D29_12950 [Leptolyngbyaceae cyanobacterium]
MNISQIGFLGVHYFEDKSAIRGAILITDIDTKPLEFRITSPVRPQNFQEIIYGELMHEYIAVDLIALPLINALESKPDVILVYDELLFNICKKQTIPTLRVMESDAPLMSKKIDIKTLSSEDSNFPPIKVYTSEEFLDDLSSIVEKLKLVFAKRDLIEPFRRIERACIDVHNRDANN